MSMNNLTVESTIIGTSVGKLPTGTGYVQLLCRFEHDGNDVVVPVKIFVTEKSRHVARRQLKKLGYDNNQGLTPLMQADRSPLAGTAAKIVLEETKYGVQGKLLDEEMTLNAKELAAMEAALKGGGDDEPAEPADEGIPF